MEHKTQRDHLNFLKIDSLLSWLKGEFSKTKDVRGSNVSISLSDSLMSGLALYPLKGPTLLFFNNNRSSRAENLKTMYKIEKAPSDSALRVILDEVPPAFFRPVFRGSVRLLRKAGIWKMYGYYQGHMICSIDGAHHYSSEKVHCGHCLECTKSNGAEEYRHYMLSGVVVPPGEGRSAPGDTWTDN